jgi:diguanylate cyclase (GGDEF)-like protein
VAAQEIQCWLTDLVADPRLEEVLDKIVETATAACPGHEFALLILVEDELSVVRTSGLGPGARRRLEVWARDSASALSEALEIDDLERNPELSGLASRLSQGALLALPLLVKRRSLGVLIALAPQGEAFDDDDRNVLTAFAEQVAVAIANAHLVQRLLENATHDALTDLPNRREFDRLLARELERSNRYDEIFSLAILDIDEFKQLNDSRGHHAGDTLLRQVADTIREVCRASDVAGRLGGDEFAVLLPETNQFQAAALCERLRAEVETLGDVSLSWGIAEYTKHGVTVTALMRAADAAMYASKPRMVGGERALSPAG